MKRRTTHPRAAGLALIALLSCRGGGAPPSSMKVTLVEPLAGAFVSGTVAVAADVVGGVDPVRITVLVDGQERAHLDTPPFVTGLDLGEDAGKTVTLAVSASDAAGNQARDQVSIRVVAEAPGDDSPRIEIVRPEEGAQVCGDVLVEARATDKQGIARLVLYLDGKILHQETSDLLRWLWPTRSAPNGVHALALEGRDVQGRLSVARWKVTVDNSGATCAGDLAVAIERPAEGAVVTGPVAVRARVTGQAAAPVVRFVADGAQFAVDTAAPFEAVWNSGAFPEGAHRLRAVLGDEAGRQVTGEAGVTVDRTPPTVAVATPGEDANVSGDVSVTVAAADAVGVAAVTATVSRDGVAVADLGTRTTPPFSFTWKTDALSGGVYWIEAKATDLVGLVATASRSVRLGRPSGAACARPAECQSGFCADGVCCAEACTGSCRSCAGPTAGECALVTSAPDGDSCPGLCDGAGKCKTKAGGSCQADQSCITGFCADGVCCDRACDGVCERCDAPATAGTCAPVKDAEDGPICTGGSRRCTAEAACLSCTKGPCEPAYSWTRAFTAPSPSRSFTHDVAVGPDGTIIAVGSWGGTVDFGQGVGSLTSPGSGIIIKFDAGGNVLWSRTLAGASTWLAAVGLDRSVYVVGSFRGLLDLDPTAGIDQHDGGLNSEDVFLIKLTSDGKYVWGRTLSSGGPFSLYNAKTTPEGNIIVNGSFESTIDLDPGAGTDQITSAGGKGFIIEISPAGERIWSRQVMLVNTNPIFELTVGRDGAVVYGGQFSGTVDLDPTDGVDMHTSAGGMDAFVAVLDAAGKFRWARSVGSAKDENGFAVVDGAGNVYLGGIFMEPFQSDAQGPVLSVRGNFIGAFMIQYDKDGGYRWAHDLAGDNEIVPRRGVAVAPDGILVAGQYYGHANFDPVGSHPVVPVVGMTWFFMRWTSDGQLGWVQTLGHTSSGTRPRLAAVPWGGFVFGENFNYTVDFDPGPGVDERTSDLDDDGFVTAITR